MNIPSGLEARLPECSDENLPVGGVLENRLAPVPPVHYIVSRSGIFNSQRTWHGIEFDIENRNCQNVGLTPLTLRYGEGASSQADFCCDGKFQ